MSLDQGRHTWRHTNINQYIVNSVETFIFKVYSDLAGHQTSNGRSLPPSLTVTTLKPDNVIIDEKEKKCMIYELNVPFESNIHKQPKYKTNKYAHFKKDIKKYDTKVIAFEIGSSGSLTSDNKMRLKDMHKHLIKKDIKSKTFTSNITSLATTSSLPGSTQHGRTQQP